MPRDDWARAKVRDIQRRARWDDSFPRIERQKRKRSKPHQIVPERQQEPVAFCPACKSINVRREPVTFKDGSEHIKTTCGKCRRFIKWG